MASSNEFVNDFDASADISYGHSPSTVKSKLFSANINDLVADFALIKYSNRIFITVTENKKIGNLYSIHTNTPQRDGIHTHAPTVYDIKCMLGVDSEEKTVAVRALVGKLGITQPLLLSLTLTTLDYSTVNSVAENILANKCW